MNDKTQPSTISKTHNKDPNFLKVDNQMGKKVASSYLKKT